MWLTRKQVELRELKEIAQAKPCNTCGELKLPGHTCPPKPHVDDMQRLKGRLSVRCVGRYWSQIAQKQISPQGVATWYCRRCKCKHKARVIDVPPLKPDPRPLPDRGGRPTDPGDTFGT